jgi:hypothetical protein
MKACALLLFTLLLTGCGYRFSQEREGAPTLSVSFVQGDNDGTLTCELTRQLTSSGAFRLVQQGGRYLLKVALVGGDNQRIGYRYDRDDVSGKLQKNLVGTENRRLVTAEISVVDTSTGQMTLGPLQIHADADHDFVGTHSLRGLTFINSSGKRETALSFSLGQLDSIEGAQDDVAVPLYRVLAQKIVDGMISQKW